MVPVYGGVLQIQAYSPLLLDRPTSELELCRQGALGYTRGCTQGDAMDGPNAGMTMSTNYDSQDISKDFGPRETQSERA